MLVFLLMRKDTSFNNICGGGRLDLSLIGGHPLLQLLDGGVQRLRAQHHVQRGKLY